MLLVEVTLLLVLLEIGIRKVVPPQVDVPHLRVSPKGFYTWYPGSEFTYHNLPDVTPPQATVRINEDGLRGESIPVVKEPHERRVLVLGDSFTASVQLPEDVIFTTLLERELNSGATDLRYRVLNAGFNGAGTAHELLYFLDRGRALQPDILVVVYAFNDLDDNLTHEFVHWHDGRLELREDLAPPGCWRRPLLAVRDWLGNHSLAFYLLYRASRDAVRRLGGREASAGTEGGEDAPPALELLHDLFARLISSANGLGIPVIVLTIPSPLHVSGAEPSWQRIHALLARLVSGTDNQLIPMAGAFAQAEADGRSAYLAHDGHLSPEGHRIVAGALARAVRRYHVLPAHQSPAVPSRAAITDVPRARADVCRPGGA